MSIGPTPDALAFLKNNFVGVLATSYLNLPYASTIYYTSDDKFNIYFVTKMNTRQISQSQDQQKRGSRRRTVRSTFRSKWRGHATILKGQTMEKPYFE